MKNKIKLSSRVGLRITSGFTLIELLVSISIIAALVVLIIPNMMGARERSVDAQKRNDLKSMKDALRMYYNDNQAYPTIVEGANFEINNLSGLTGYLPAISQIGYTYYYSVGDSGDSFTLWTVLETEKSVNNINSQLSCGSTMAEDVGGSMAYAVCAK